MSDFQLPTLLTILAILTCSNENAWALTSPPVTCPLCQYFCPKVIQGCQDITPYKCTNINLSETSEITFFNLVSLTFDLWPWPSNSSKILSSSMPPPNIGCVCQTVQPWERSQTDRHTDWTDFIPSAASAGGNNNRQSGLSTTMVPEMSTGNVYSVTARQLKPQTETLHIKLTSFSWFSVDVGSNCYLLLIDLRTTSWSWID